MTVGGYRIVETLTDGSHRARRGDAAPVTLRVEQIDADAFGWMAVDETRLYCLFRHANLEALLDIGYEAGQLFVATEPLVGAFAGELRGLSLRAASRSASRRAVASRTSTRSRAARDGHSRASTAMSRSTPCTSAATARSS